MPPALDDSVDKNPQQPSSNEDDAAVAIPGVALQLPSPEQNDPPIQIVYTNAPPAPPIKGVALLLHGCSHSAFKFFSPSPACPDCVGLSEELRIVRLVLARGYFPLAVSSFDRMRGCWGNGKDAPRIAAALQHDLFRKYGAEGRVFGIGASSGGAFAAHLAMEDVVEAALVMVMALSDDVVRKMKQSPKPMYLAPMPLDRGTTKRALQNYWDLQSVKEYFVMDSTACASLPVTTQYLVQRVVGLTSEDADSLISQLKAAGHLDASNMLVVDPTKSDWRSIVSPTNSTHWLGRFSLKPGFSPLAKALHRAWAMHEYCSEAVPPALDFFEGWTRGKGAGG
ncbi:hypothetical protein ACHAXT_012741 [Thalassiosira profunda]